MVTSSLNQILQSLGLFPDDLAARLGVDSSEVQSWRAGGQLPARVSEVIDAWQFLHAANLPWGADLESVLSGDQDQIRRHQDHDRALVQIIRNVRSRGGPSTDWAVNLQQRNATLNAITVSFYALASGSFSLSNYCGSDGLSDIQGDKHLIEDAVAAFAQAVSEVVRARPGERWDQ